MELSLERLRAELAAAHARVVDAVGRLDDDRLRQPSRLAGWTRDLLVAHLRFGADAAVRGIDGVRSGTSSSMYPGGEPQREDEIASGAGASGAELAADLAAASRRLEAVLADLPGEAWDGLVESRRGPVPVREIVRQRWLDVEVHHVDLDLGYEPDRWPDVLVDDYLPRLVSLLPALRRRPDADASVSGSWHFHRTDAAGEWTVLVQGDDVSVTEAHAKGDCAVRGSGRDLLAYLLGRAAEVEVFGDAAKAASFKEAFPGP